MGSSQSSLSVQKPQDLDVLQAGRPLSVLLQCAREDSSAIRLKQSQTVDPDSPGPPPPSPRTPILNALPSPNALPSSPVLSLHVSRPDKAVYSPRLQPLALHQRPETTSLSRSTESSLSIDNQMHLSESPPLISPSPHSGMSTSPSSEAKFSRTDVPTASPIIPRDPDHEFWSTLFKDFVVFESTAQSSHRSAFRVLSSATSAPRGVIAKNVALVFRAAICRIRDFVASPSTSFEHMEVLGALQLSASVMSVLSETNPSDRTLCLILGASCIDDDPQAAEIPSVSAADAIDIGHSVLWQLVTSALDCISHHDTGELYPHIALAAFNVVFVALARTYLAPQEDDPSPSILPTEVSDLPSISKFTPQTCDAESENSGSTHRNPLTQNGSTHSLLASIVDRYPRPGVIVAALLDMVADSRPHPEKSILASSATGMYASTGIQKVSRGSSANSASVGSVSGSGSKASAVVANLYRQLSIGQSPSNSAEISKKALTTVAQGSFGSSGYFSTSAVMSALSAHLPGTLFFGSSSPRPPDDLKPSNSHSKEMVLADSDSLRNVGRSNPSELQKNVLADLDRSDQELSPGSSGSLSSSSTVGVSSEISDRGSAHGTLKSQFASRLPSLFSEQALALLAVLCSPRRSVGLHQSFSGITQHSGNGNVESIVESYSRSNGEENTESENQFLENPYRVAMRGLHDLPRRNVGDESTYSFSRLYSVIAAWIGDPRGALITYCLLQGNRRFRTYILARTDLDILLVPLLAAIWSRSSVSATPAPADAYVPAVVLLILTCDSEFCAAIDDIIVPLNRLLWYDDRSRLTGKGVRLSGLTMLVCIRIVQQSVLARRRVIESYLASIGVSIMANVSSSVTELNSLAADRLVALVDFIGKRYRKSLLLITHNPSEVVLGQRKEEYHETVTGTSAISGQDYKVTNQETSSAPISSSSSPVLTPREACFLGCGFETCELDCVESIAEILGTVLEVITSVLRSKSNLSVNRHVMYSLLHREHIFDMPYVRDVSVRTQVVARHIRAITLFFGDLIDEDSLENSLQSPTGRDPFVWNSSLMGDGTVSANRKGTNQVVQSPGGIGISVERVFAVIDRHARKLPPELLQCLPNLEFEYQEKSTPDFFLTYSWTLALRDSALRWDPSQFPDSPLPLSRSVFNPPRPPHGSTGQLVSSN